LDFMSNEALKSHYLAYIARLNAHIPDASWSLEPFVNDQVSHNGRQMTRADYESMIHGHYEVIPDLHYDLQMLLASESEVAARIQFVCSPTKEFLGWKPKTAGGGEKVTFAENVFYRFEGGKIKEVLSNLETPRPL